MRVIVIGGGWSFKEFAGVDFREYGWVVGVNESAVLCQVNVGITMDRLWAEHRARDFFLKHPGADLWVRRGADKNLPYHPRRLQFECNHKSVKMVDTGVTFNGTNSGMCALSYAYQRRPNKIFLFGFDMCKGPKGEPYWHDPYPWARADGATKPGKYAEWAAQFDSVARQFEQVGTKVFNVSSRTAIKSFPILTFQQFVTEASK
jgi:hypothetical protein